MGWNTYFGLGAPNEKDVRGVADFLVSSGLRDAGYKIVWIDGGWNAPTPRDGAGNLVEDPAKFPGGFPKLVSDLHAKGLKAGIYTDAGPSDGEHCAAGSGGGYYEKDAKRFADWKFDAIKIDFLCGIFANLKPAQAFADFSAAVQKAGRPMVLNLCNPVTDEWGVPHTPDQVAHISYSFGPLLADSWRTSTDVAFGTPYEGIWRDVLRNMDRNAWHAESNGPGHYNDPDYLIPMRKTQQGTYELNEEESTSQFVMWAQMASPLIIGSDPRTLPPSMVSTLKNPEILAVNQDPLAIQGVRVASTDDTDVYSKVLSRKGERSVVLLNRRDVPAEMTVNFADAGLRGAVSVRDLRARADRGVQSDKYTVTVPPHGTAMFKLRGTDLVPGEAVGSDATASPAIARVGEEAIVFSRGLGGELKMLRGGKWSSLGKAILGQPAVRAVGSDVEVTVRGTDNRAWQRTLHNGRWGTWKSLGGKLTDAPSVSPNGTVVTRGSDGEVWLYSGTWTSLGAPGDAPIYGRPSVAGGFGAVRTADDSVWVRPVSGGSWTSLGGVISGSPTLVEYADRIYLFARASDYTLWQVNHTDGAWGGWFKRSEFPSNSLVGAVGATAGPDGSAWTVVRGPDNKVYRQKL
jgi:alpha-galactosidase